MAATPQIQYCDPPTFHGKDDEDATEWLARYEASGRYNNWDDPALFTNFERYIEGACRQWFQCLVPAPTHWEDTLEVPAANGAARIPPTIQAKSLFKAAFQQENYALYQEQHLRNKIQERDESATSYYYDVLSLCRKVDPAMAEQTKLNFLYKGLNRGLLRQIYPLQPATCADFLAKVKIFNTTELLAKQQCSLELEVKEMAEKLSERDQVSANLLRLENSRITDAYDALKIKVQDKERELSVNTLRQDTSEMCNPDDDMRQQFNQLVFDVQVMKNTISNGKSNQNGSSRNKRRKNSYSQNNQNQETSNQDYFQDNRNQNYSQNNSNQSYPQNNQNQYYHSQNEPCFIPWDPNINEQQHDSYIPSQPDRPFCNYCGNSGHWIEYCSNNPHSENYSNNCQQNFNEGSRTFNSADPPNQVFKMNLSSKNSIKENFLCGRQEVEGVIDTAADISAIDFEFLKETPFAMQKWRGPELMMVNGTMEKPMGGARIYIKHKKGSAFGLVVVLKMGGIRLLLGNDLLKQFKNVSINYESKGNPVTLGETPSAVFQPQCKAPFLSQANSFESTVSEKEIELIQNVPLPMPVVSLDTEKNLLKQEIKPTYLALAQIINMDEPYSHIFIDRSESDHPEEQDDFQTELFDEEKINEDTETNHVMPFDYQPLLLDKKPICTQCGSIGHIMRECAFNPESESFRKLQTIKDIYDQSALILNEPDGPCTEREAVFVSVFYPDPSVKEMFRSGSDRLKEGEDETNINVNLVQKSDSFHKVNEMINQIQSMEEISQFFSFLILLNMALTQKSKEAKFTKRIIPISKFIDEEKLFVIKMLKEEKFSDNPMFKRDCIMSYFRSRGIDPITSSRRPFQLWFGETLVLRQLISLTEFAPNQPMRHYDDRATDSETPIDIVHSLVRWFQPSEPMRHYDDRATDSETPIDIVRSRPIERKNIPRPRTRQKADSLHQRPKINTRDQKDDQTTIL